MTGLFAQKELNGGGADGAFYGHPVQLWYQIAGILTGIGIYIFVFFLNHKILLKICLTLKGFATVCTAGILLPLKYTIGIRLSPEEEIRGLDYIGKFSKKTCL